MKISSLLCVACMLTAQLSAFGDDAGNIPLPPGSRIPAAAQNAAAAPPWNAPPAQTVIPAAPIAPPINMSAPAQPAAAISPNPQPRPLVSVMKRKSQPSPTVTPPAVASSQLPAPPSEPLVQSPSTTPSATSVAPLALTTSQTDGALPINTATTTPEPTTHSVAQDPTSSAVVPAEYDQPVTPSNTSALNWTRPNEPSSSTATSQTSSQVDASPDATTGNSQASSTAPSPLQPTSGPVQLIPPPSDSSRTAPSITDQQVIPADSNSQTADVLPDPQQMAAAHAAADLLSQALNTNSSADLPGQWQPLSNVISSVDEHQRLAAVSAYWRLSHAVCLYLWSTDDLQRLEKATPSHTLIDNPMLSTARASATARVHEAELNLTKAQQSLVALMGTTPSTFSANILPSDRPLVGPYRTYFDALFANRPAPGHTREINAALPLRVKIIGDRAAAVRSALDALHYAQEARSRGDADLKTVLACHEDLHRQRREFLDAILDYNLDIADYAVAVAAPGTPHDQFVAMLIRPKPVERLSSIPERSTFDSATAPSYNFTPSGSQSSNSQSSTSSVVRNPNSTGQTRSASDGWVPSSLRPLEPEASQAVPESPRAAAPPPVVNPVNPLGQQRDPFAPSVGDRYNNRYNENR